MRRAWLAVHRGLAALSIRRFGLRYARALLRYADHLPLLKGPPPQTRLRYAERAVATCRGASGRDLARALAVVARYRLRLGRADETLAAAREGVAADNQEPDARHALALALLRLDRPDESLVAAQAAVDLYRARVDDDPRRLNRYLADALDTAARGLVRLGRHEEALAAYTEALGLFARTPWHLQMRYFVQIRSTQAGTVQALRFAGRHEEALTLGAGALTWLDSGMGLMPGRLLAVRAPLLRHLASCHAALGHHDEALSTVEKAVRDYRRLSAVGAADPAGLAWALDCLADRQHDLGRDADAVASLREAVEVRTGLAESDAEAHRADLASTWAGLSNRLWNLGEQAEAIDATRQSAAAYRLAGSEDLLADVLRVLGNRLSRAGQPAEAVAAGKEAVTVGRRLAEQDGDVHAPLLARCLTDLLVTLAEGGRREEALRAAEEAAAIRRRLAAQDLSYEPDLARSLRHLAERLASLDRTEEAAATCRDAVEIWRLVATVDARERIELCSSLHDLALLLSGLHRHDEAVDVMTESIDIRRLLVAEDPASHEVNLGRALRQRSFDLAAVRRFAEALPDIDAAIELFRRLAAADPDEHLVDVAYALRQAARQQAGTGHAAKAVEHLRELHDLAHKHDLPELDQIAASAFVQVCREAPDEVAQAWRSATGTSYPVIC